MRARWFLPILIAPTLVLGPAVAASYPEVIPLPVDWAGEGIATSGHTFYAGSLLTGDIYRGDLRSGTGALFIDEEEALGAVGLKADRRHGLLFVSGGGNGDARVYDLRTGDRVAEYAWGPNVLVNDVVVTRDAAYFTDTFSPQIFRVPIDHDGTLGPSTTIAVTGPAGVPHAGLGLNGIDATPDGKTLIVNHTDFGGLYTVDPTTGESVEIEVTGGTLAAGTLDGLLRDGHSVWVVENFLNRVTKVRMNHDWTAGEITATVTHPAFQIPATVASHGSRLVAVNAKFDLGLPPPFGPGAPPGTPFEVVQVKAP